MPEFKFPTTLISGGAIESLTAFNGNAPDPIFQADSRHPHWKAIIAGLRAGDEKVWSLFNVAEGVMAGFKQVTDRVSFNGSEVLWDGDPIHSVLADQLQRALQDGHEDNYVALARFWEKLESNPEPHSREQAFDFLGRHKFQITQDGDVVGYKGFREGADGVLFSTAASGVPNKPSAFVNGVAIAPLSTVPQRVGDVVTMPRSEVTHDPNRSCERGLHVATRAYASSYGTLGEVLFNPRDIVSVPTADSGAKVRVNRYVLNRLVNKNVPDDHEAPVLRQGETRSWAGDVGSRV